MMQDCDQTTMKANLGHICKGYCLSHQNIRIHCKYLSVSKFQLPMFTSL